MTEINPQFIRVAGAEMVLLTRAEFDALVARGGPEDEDDADAALFADRLAELNAGRDERLPEAVSTLVLRGDSLLRALRKWRDLTQAEVARRAGLSQGFVSDLEKGTRPGSPLVFEQLAEVYDVPIGWLSPTSPDAD